jgi:hypothetical protein
MSPIVSAVLFALVASPSTYKLTRSVAGDWVATSEGTAKIGGLILHAFVFAFLLHLVWRMIKSKKSTYLTQIVPGKY